MPRGRGRPTLYRPEYCQQLVDFFSVEPYRFNENSKKLEATKTPWFIEFALKIGVTTETLHEWTLRHPEFSYAYKKANALQARHIAENAKLGHFEQPMSIFMLKNLCGWRDVQELKHSGYIEHSEEKDAIKKEVADFMAQAGIK